MTCRVCKSDVISKKNDRVVCHDCGATYDVRPVQHSMHPAIR